MAEYLAADGSCKYGVVSVFKGGSMVRSFRCSADDVQRVKSARGNYLRYTMKDDEFAALPADQQAAITSHDDAEVLKIMPTGITVEEAKNCRVETREMVMEPGEATLRQDGHLLALHDATKMILFAPEEFTSKDGKFMVDDAVIEAAQVVKA